jgi:hypothetical protein
MTADAALSLLGGAHRSRPRARGFAPTQALLDQVSTCDQLQYRKSYERPSTPEE